MSIEIEKFKPGLNIQAYGLNISRDQSGYVFQSQGPAGFLKLVAIHLPFLSRYFCKGMPSSWEKVGYTPPTCITIRLPFAARYLCRSVRVRGRWVPPKSLEGPECPKSRRFDCDCDSSFESQCLESLAACETV